MLLSEYQKKTRETAIYPKEAGIQYTVAGLCNEAGEVAGKFKKYIRKDFNYEEFKEKIKGEMGDCLWYLSELANNLNFSLDDILAENVKKLEDRKNRGTLQGDGDTR